MLLLLLSVDGLGCIVGFQVLFFLDLSMGLRSLLLVDFSFCLDPDCSLLGPSSPAPIGVQAHSGAWVLGHQAVLFLLESFFGAMQSSPSGPSAALWLVGTGSIYVFLEAEGM